MLQLTSRDEAMLDWMNVVRLADVDAIRWALSAYQDEHDGPVSVRRANHWIARMANLGYLGRMRPLYRARQIVWPTHRASGRGSPTLFRQTMRHEVAVAAVSGRYIAAGYEWSRDRDTRHCTDGVAESGGATFFLEIELTPKSRSRYQRIFEALAARLAADDAASVTYCCTPEVARFASQEADRMIFRGLRSRLSFHACLDAQGSIVDHAFPDLTR